MYTYKEIQEKAQNMTVKQLKFFYNTVFGEDGYFTYLEDIENLKIDLEDMGENIDDYNVENKNYYIWDKDGYVMLFDDYEAKIWLLSVITEDNFNIIDSSNINCKEWVSNVYVDSVNNC